MPNISICGATLFTRAKDSAVKRGFNNAPGAKDRLADGVDTDVQNRLQGGICSGITSTWVIRLLSGSDDARVPGKYIGFFDNVARFQGSYFKDVHGRIDNHLTQLGKIFNANVKHIKDLSGEAFNANVFPQAVKWGAYVSAFGHAIGAGRHLSEFYLMDPNVGLLVYGDIGAMTADLNDFVRARTVAPKGPRHSRCGLPCRPWKGLAIPCGLRLAHNACATAEHYRIIRLAH